MRRAAPVIIDVEDSIDLDFEALDKKRKKMRLSS